jgi:carbamate kinase
VIRHANGSLIGVEAVVDKDASSGFLARSLKADALLLLTDVDAVYRDFGTADATKISHVTPDAALSLDAPEGSMAPKLRAAAEFASHGGMAAIGRLADALLLLDGKAGTRIATNPK